MKNNSTSAEHLQVSNEAVMVVDKKSGISTENIDSHSVGHQVEEFKFESRLDSLNE